MKKALPILAIVIAALLITGWTITNRVLTGELAYAAAGPAIGEPLPGFELKDADGKTHTLAQHKDKVVALVFTSMGCPWALAAQPQLDALAKEYAPKDVVFLGIDSNDGTTPEALKQFAEENNVAFPILLDTGNAYANTLSAKVTPEIFLVDKTGTLVYHGAFDNRMAPNQTGTEAHFKLALDAVLEGKPVEKSQVKAWGCSIKRAL